MALLVFAAILDSPAARAQAPSPGFPSPCLNGCYDEYRRCIAGYGSETACSIRYNQCFGGCGSGTTGPPLPEPVPRTQPLNFGDVRVRQAKRVVFRVTNNVSKALIKRGKATLYASWTPPNKDNLGAVSNPQHGPFNLGFGYRWELKAGEGQNVAVDFAPASVGTVYAPRLYLWWDSYTHFSWCLVFDVKGTGLPPESAPPPGAPPSGVTSGLRGGLETIPLWMAADGGTAYRPPLWANLNGLGARSYAESPRSRRRAVDPSRRVSIPLSAVIPEAVGSSVPRLREPEAVIGGSNAVESIAADYIDEGTGTVVAVILAFRTRNDVYAHTYPVCARVKGAWLDSVHWAQTVLPGATVPATFWESTMTTPDEDGSQRQESATSFAVYASASGKSFLVDSRWLSEEYPRHTEPDGEILTFQVWSPDAQVTASIRAAVLERFRQLGNVAYRNTAAVGDPDVFIVRSDYSFDNALLWIENTTASDRTLELAAVTWSAANPQSRLDFHFNRTVPPGLSSLALPMPGRLNGVVYATANDSTATDMVYFADGSWFSFGESAPPPWTSPDCPPARLGPNDLAAAGCARLVTDIPADGWRGIGRAFNTYTKSHIDVAEMAAVSFLARGDRRTAELQVGSLDDQGHRMVHHAYFTPSPEGRQITIPFAWLEGVNEAHDVRFTGERTIDLSWSYAGGPHAGTDLTIGNAFFSADMTAEAAPPPPSVPAGAGPIPLGLRLATAEEDARTTVQYRVIGERDFISVPMRQTFDVFGAELPEQPLDTRLEYFYSFTDASGRTATIPPDAPHDALVLIVSERPALLLDDFEDDLIGNRRGGAASTFHSPGGVAETSLDGRQLRLAYDVGAPESFAGWVSVFREPIDASPYDSILVRVRGDRGGEMVKLGLADSSGTEHKILLGKYAEQGVAREGGAIRVPLAAFTTIDRRTLRKVILAFENRLAADAGAIEIDEILLSASGTSLPLLIDNFDDRAPENALGGSLWTTTGGTAAMTAAHDAASSVHPSGSGYRIVASGPNGSWATAGFDLRGANATAFKQLALSMRGARGAENVHVYLASGDVRRHVAVTLSADWQRFAIPLSDFQTQGVDLSKLDRLELVWEFRDFSETIDLDDVALESAP